MRKTALPLAACLLALVAAGASAQNVFKWRDANGTMHISDTPPPPGAARDVAQGSVPGVGGVQATPAAAPASGASGAAGGDGELQKRKAKADQERAAASAAEKARVEQHNAAARASNCAAAQANSRNLNSGMRVAAVNAKGEREYLDDAAIAAKNKQAQQVIDQNCGPARQ